MSNETSQHDERLRRALISLDGLSVGDAFGQMLAGSGSRARQMANANALPGGPWWHTDDTQMAMAIVEELAVNQRIDADALAERFARRYLADTGRGYGKGARLQLDQIGRGANWREVSAAAFGGQGSKGNGGAMRSAPLGAYFADDLEQLVAESSLSAEVTHAHREGVAGSVAVSLAAAAAWNARSLPLLEARKMVWDTVLRHTPPGETLNGLRKARLHHPDLPPESAAELLGSGQLVTAPDTVPFAIWSAARRLDRYRDAMLDTLEGDGDCDTNCAIVGGIVVLHAGHGAIPRVWMESREGLNLELP